MRCAPRTAIRFGYLVRGVGDERRLRSAVSRTERAAGLWSGVEPTTRSGRVRRDLICICLERQWLGWLEAGVGGAIAPPV